MTSVLSKIRATARRRFATATERGRDERGVTLVEVMIAATFTVIVLAVAGSFLISSARLNDSVVDSSNTSSKTSTIASDLRTSLESAVLVQTTSSDQYWYLSAFVVDSVGTGDDGVSQVVKGKCKAWAFSKDGGTLYNIEKSEDDGESGGISKGAMTIPSPIDTEPSTGGWRVMSDGITNVNAPDDSVFTAGPKLTMTDPDDPNKNKEIETKPLQLKSVRVQFAIESGRAGDVSFDDTFQTATAVAGIGADATWPVSSAASSCLEVG